MKKLLIAILILAFGLSNYSIPTQGGDTDTWISTEIQIYCYAIGEQYGICPEVLEAIIESESSGQQYATNGSCKGLMQVSEKWHKDRMQRLGVTDIYDLYGNILVGTDYLMELAEDYGEIAYVLDVYHGDSKADYNAEHGIMSKYADKILNRSHELEVLHGK